ncbi:histidine phosphatase superfamily [Neohortaea acidophila]|uniref:Histidine phosphatase superfamily n=1 Tax=Neohortaea acidophila TaxID=245834 RepID=A0A6A6Q5I1_9PEZI|nr:histidine phosphatase superfamily [Neohortaea acidophila]KAF2487206.1 histidine phosphatase superfamily [Neohortaea acidophila]
MPPLLHVMRHGQGFHNISDNGHDIRDPELTDKGREQCRERREAFERHDKVELLLASPLRRALQTCAIAFAPSVERGLTIIALPTAEEASNAPCDTGSEIELLKAEFPEHVDFDHVKHGWWVHEGEYAFEPKALISRAAKLRRWIKARPEKEVVLVSHGFFNHFLTGDVDAEGNQTTPWWKEAELRTYRFREGASITADGLSEIDGEDGAALEETPESLMRLKDRRRASVVDNKNRPEERKESLDSFRTDREAAT